MKRFLKWTSIALFALYLFALIGGLITRPDRRELSIYDASASTTLLAAVAVGKEHGSSLAIFDLGGDEKSVRIFANGAIDSPLVVDEDRLIFVLFAEDRSDTSRYRLVEVELGSKIVCKVLTESKLGMTEPFMMRGKLGDRVFFLTGKDDSSTRFRITYRKIAYLKNGLVHTFNNSEIYPFGTISQIDETRIIGGAYHVKLGTKSMSSPRASTLIFPVEVVIGETQVNPSVSAVSANEVGEFFDFNHSMETGVTAVRSSIGSAQKLNTFGDSGRLLKMIDLPDSILFGTILYSRIDAGGKISVSLMAAADSDTPSEARLATVSEDGLTSYQPLSLLGLREFDLDACIRR